MEARMWYSRTRLCGRCTSVGGCATTDRLAGGRAAGLDGRAATQRQLHRRDAQRQLRPPGGPDGRKISPRSGHRVARRGDAQLGAAVRDDRAGRRRRRRRYHLRLRPRRSVRLEHVDPGFARADPRFRPAARDHPHDFRQPLPPAVAPLGRRGGRHQRRTCQRKEQAPPTARPVPPHRPGDRLQPDVRHDRLSARTSCRSTPRATRWPSS